jgi:hypothetical protein
LDLERVRGRAIPRAVSTSKETRTIRYHVTRLLSREDSSSKRFFPNLAHNCQVFGREVGISWNAERNSDCDEYESARLLLAEISGVHSIEEIYCLKMSHHTEYSLDIAFEGEKDANAKSIRRT